MTTEHVKVDKLRPHELNDDIYTNKNIDKLVDKINTYGFQDTQPLLATSDNKILSGHRRYRAAKKVGIEKVPVQYVDTDGEQDELFTLLLANQYRDKTAAEKINEGEAWEKIEKEKAKEREHSGGVENFPQGETGKSRDKVGEKIGVSGRTFEKGKKVKQKAEQGDETAQEEWKRMETGEQSIHGAYQNVKRSENIRPGQSKKPIQSPERTTPKYEWVNTTPKDINIQARDCDTDGKYRIYVNDDEYTINAELYSKLFRDNP